jgi:alpha/beta superfamily hydrolase
MLRTINFSSAGSRTLCLEGVFHIPEVEGRLPSAVICHPHPLGGGSMNNGVVVAIARALASRGVIALRFNFRGVGASEGVHDDGRGERDDVAGALDELLMQPNVDPDRVSLVGYSFGACVGLAHAEKDRRVTAYAAVGLSLDFCDSGGIRAMMGEDEGDTGSATESLAIPKLFITGERDQLAPPGELLKLVEQLPEPKSVEIVPGADHFWWGAEQEVAARVAGFVTGLWANC